MVAAAVIRIEAARVVGPYLNIDCGASSSYCVVGVRRGSQVVGRRRSRSNSSS